MPKTLRKELLDRLAGQPRSVSALARELGLTRRDVEEDVRHALKSAEAAGYRIHIEPARCRSCGFLFDTHKLSKPSKCPSCRGSRILEAQVTVAMDDNRD